MAAQASSKWSAMTESKAEIAKLHLLTSTQKILYKEGYVFEQLTVEELKRKVRCETCGQKMRKRDIELYQEAIEHEDWEAYVYDPKVTQKHNCFFHDGELFKSTYQCCNGHMFAQGCCSNRLHIPCLWTETEEAWLYNRTPAPVAVTSTTQLVPGQSDRSTQPRRAIRGSGRSRYTNAHTQAQSSTPTISITKDIRAAVALDCEMGTPKAGTSYDNVLIRISMVDFFTGEALIDQLVVPSVPMLHYNTRYSGVTFSAMRIASRSPNSIRGTDAAREQVLRYVDSNTFIIMHSGNHDLSSLRLMHPANRIIDTYVLEVYHREVKDEKLKRNLKDVCLRRCGVVVQNAKLENGKAGGHDSLEDALAAREIVCAWMKGIPGA